MGSPTRNELRLLWKPAKEGRPANAVGEKPVATRAVRGPKGGLSKLHAWWVPEKVVGR